MASNGDHKRRAHVLMVPADGSGHIYPFVQLLYHLSSPQYVNNVIVTVVTTSVPFSQELALLKARGDFQSLDLRVEINNFPSMAKISPEVYSAGVQASFELHKAKLLHGRDDVEAPSCIIADMFFFWLQELAEELRISWYPLYPAASWYTFCCLIGEHPVLQSDEMRNEKIPGLEFGRVFDFPDDILSEPEYFVNKAKRLEKATAVLVNVVEEWDAPTGALKGLRKYLDSKAVIDNRQAPGIIAVGPVVNIDGFTLAPQKNLDLEERPECLRWLDTQPTRSVLYVAFGTLVSMNPEAVSELALGLEDSGVSFLWALRVPASSDLISAIPPGWEARVKQRGFIERSFAPQARILKHPSIAGFLSHCGWNSTMESICAGIPLITWPLALDQPLNARLVVDVWKAGVGIKNSDEGYGLYGGEVTKEEVSKAVRKLLIEDEGKKVWANVEMMKEVAETAVRDGGSSHTALYSFLEEITNRPAQSLPLMN